MMVWIASSLTILAALESPEDHPAPDTLVICPTVFQQTLQPWIEYRRQQGHRIRVEPPAETSYGVRMQVRRAAQTGELNHVLLIGDAVGNGRPGTIVPADYVRARVNVKFGSEPEICSDATYADLDSDGVPDLALGRLPVDSADELRSIIDRIIAYEQADTSGPWLGRVNLIAGVGGFGPTLDWMIEQSARQMITGMIPPTYRTSMTYGSWSSPFCPHPYRFSQTAIERFNEGCVFWCYIGHGSRHRLDRVMLPDGRAEILDNRLARQLASRAGAPIAIFLACYTGAIDDPQDCLSEVMLRQPRGPIAVISSTRVAMPYAMAILSLELMDGYFTGSAPTLGELMLQAKQKMVTAPDRDNEYRQLIEGMGRAFSPEPGLLDAERREHVHLMQLLGDPLLRLKRPQPIELDVAPTAIAGQELVVRGTAPAVGKLTVEVCYRRDRFRIRPPHRNDYDPTQLDDYDRVYRDSHNLVCWRKTVDVEPGPFDLTIPVPIDANGNCNIRAMLESPGQFALGAQPIFIQPQR